jgi:hypothetical protein
MIAALFVETNGCYFNLPGVDPWDINRDARKYAGPHPVVAHPPCQRWGRYCGQPELIWGPSEQKIHPVALERYGYEKARRIGMMAMIGGKDKTRIRNATPPAFRDVLLSLAPNATDHRAEGSGASSC